jgi:hypothetical protein
VHVLVHVGFPVARRIVELDARVGLARALQRAVVFERVRRTDTKAVRWRDVHAERDRAEIVVLQAELRVGTVVAPDGD